MKPLSPPKYIASTFSQDILTLLEDDHGLWSTSTQPLKFLFLADKGTKDTLPLLTALPDIQHATAKENKQPSRLPLWGYHAKPIWLTAWSLLSQAALTLRGGCGGRADGKAPFWKGHLQVCIHPAHTGHLLHGDSMQVRLQN